MFAYDIIYLKSLIKPIVAHCKMRTPFKTFLTCSLQYGESEVKVVGSGKYIYVFNGMVSFIVLQSND